MQELNFPIGDVPGISGHFFSRGYTFLEIYWISIYLDFHEECSLFGVGSLGDV